MGNVVDQECVIGGIRLLLTTKFKTGASSSFQDHVLLTKVIENNFSILCKLDISMEEAVVAAFGGSCLEELFTKADLMRAANESLEYKRNQQAKTFVEPLD